MAVSDSAIDVLHASKLLGPLPEECLKDLASKMKLMEVNDGHVFIKEGQGEITINASFL